MEIEKQRNKGGATRWLALLGGGAAVYWGVKRRSWAGSAVALAGVNYAVRGITGDRSLLQLVRLHPEAAGGVPYGKGIKIRRSVTIDKSPEELYRFWHNFENLPRFMKHVESVRVSGERHSHWVVTAPAGRTVEWDAEIITDRPGEIIGWRTLGGSMKHAGSVRFERAPGNRGSYVRVQLQYNPPAGRLGSVVAKLFGEEPDQQIKEDLARFKELMEVGEIPTTEGQPSGRAQDRRRAPRMEHRPQREMIRRGEPVEQASEESFPASDAPSWTAGGGH